MSGPFEPKVVAGDAPEINALLAKGRPMNVALIGAMAVELTARFDSEALLTRPDMRHTRLAFSMWDRIRLKEMKKWPCTLCGVERSGLSRLSCFAVIDRVEGGFDPNKPAMVAAICESCDSISTQETKRRICEMFGLESLPEAGHG